MTPAYGKYKGTTQHVRYGPGAVQELERDLRDLGVKRPLVVTGSSVASGGLAEAVANEAGCGETSVWPESQAHCPVDVVAEGLNRVHEGRHDCLISVGGSSPIELSVAISMAFSGRLTLHPPAISPDGGPRPRLPVLAVTTTLSQGEFTDVLGITDSSGYKFVLRDPEFLPDFVYLDARLFSTTPTRIVASTGVKALDSALAAYAGGYGGLFGDSVIRNSVVGLLQGLWALSEGEDELVLRQDLQLSAWMAFFARFHMPQEPVIQDHRPWFSSAARHQIGGLTNAAHATISAILLPATLHFHRHDYGNQLGTVAQQAVGGDLDSLIGRVQSLVKALDLPGTLGDVGVESASLEDVVDAMGREDGYFLRRRDECIELLRNLL